MALHHEKVQKKVNRGTLVHRTVLSIGAAAAIVAGIKGYEQPQPPLNHQDVKPVTLLVLGGVPLVGGSLRWGRHKRLNRNMGYVGSDGYSAVRRAASDVVGTAATTFGTFVLSSEAAGKTVPVLADHPGLNTTVAKLGIGAAGLALGAIQLGIDNILNTSAILSARQVSYDGSVAESMRRSYNQGLAQSPDQMRKA